MIFFTTKSGKVSKINVFALALAVVGLLDIWRPFIPADLQPFILPIVATITFLLRTFFSEGEPVEKPKL
jgi:hypothetical protein